MANRICFFTIFRQHLIATGVEDNHIIRIALDDIENVELRAPLVLYKNIKVRMMDRPTTDFILPIIVEEMGRDTDVENL